MTLAAIFECVLSFAIPLSAPAHDDIPLGFAVFGETRMLIAILASTAVMAFIERRDVWSYGLGGSRSLQMGLRGAFWGLALLSMLVAALAASGHLAMDGLSVHGYGIAIYGCLWGIAFFLAAMSEETLFRGYPFYTLARAIGFWPATILLSLVFGFVHVTNVGEATFGLASIVLVGVAFCLCLRLSGSLWWGIGFHAAWDWGQGFLFGTPVSGLLIQQRLIQSHAAGGAAELPARKPASSSYRRSSSPGW